MTEDEILAEHLNEVERQYWLNLSSFDQDDYDWNTGDIYW